MAQWGFKAPYTLAEGLARTVEAEFGKVVAGALETAGQSDASGPDLQASLKSGWLPA